MKNWKKLLVSTLPLIGIVLSVSGTEKAKTKVKEITNPVMYSAGTKSAADIDRFINKEIPPVKFDIWHSKKGRIYLHGAWKFIKLKNTKDKPNCDYGLKKGFEKPDYNDSKWFNQPVPYQWNYRYKTDFNHIKPIVDMRTKKYSWGGVGWYRKKVFIPGNLKGKRIILNCECIDHDSTIYVNGQKVKSHSNVPLVDCYNTGHFTARNNNFDVDITDDLHFGGENTIVIRVYDDSTISGKNWEGWGGIWKEIYLEAKPEIYSEYALISPLLDKSAIGVKCFIENTLKKAKKVSLSVQLGPWKSARYSLAKGDVKSYPAGNFTLKPGKNEIDFKIKIDNLVKWTTEYPYLYHFKLLDNKGIVLGQERFGYRGFTVGKHLFKLNGTDVFLMGRQVDASVAGKQFRFPLCDFNRTDVIWRFLSEVKKVNYNLCRTHSSLMPGSFYQIGDELGLLFYDEIPCTGECPHGMASGGKIKGMERFYDFKTKELTPIMKKFLRERLYKLYNYPCVVIRDGGNEIWDTPLFKNLLSAKYKFDSFKPYLDKVVAEFHKYDKTRPVAPSCGRAPTDDAMVQANAKTWGQAFGKPAHGDFYDIHKYSWHPPCEIDDEIDDPRSFKGIYKAYAIDAGKPRAILNGEVGGTAIPVAGSGWNPVLDKLFKGHYGNGKFDKKWFIDTFGETVFRKIPGYRRALSRAECFFIEFAQAELRKLANARQVKRLYEMYRRQRRWIGGFSNCYTRLFYLTWPGRPKSAGGRLLINHPSAEYIAASLQPLLATYDGKLNRNLVAGEKYRELVFVMNDTLEKVDNIAFQASFENNGKTVYKLPEIKVGSLSPAEMKTFPLNILLPKNFATGHYRGILKVFVNGKEKSSNWSNYDFYVLNPAEIKVTSKAPALIYVPDELKNSASVKNIENVFKRLNIKYETIADLDKITGNKILFLPPLSWKDEAGGDTFMTWLKKGGKVVSFQQKEMPFGIFGRIGSCRRAGYRTEILDPEYPLFKGLDYYDFFLWNGKRSEHITDKWFITYGVFPVTHAAQAITLVDDFKFAMSIAEMKIGKGLCLMSQLEALSRFGRDSVATKYLVNLFDYTLGDWNGANAVKAKLGNVSKNLEFDKKKAFFVNLRPYANMGFKDDVAHDKKGGWTDQGPKKDMRNIPTGKVSMKGVEFDIIKPDKNNGKSCIVLAGPGASRTKDFLPSKVKNIIVGKKAKKLFFLIAGAWIPVSKRKVAEVDVYFGDGKTQILFSSQTFDIVSSKNIAEWTRPGKEIPEAAAGWIGPMGNEAAKEVAVYIAEWTNPDPDRVIESINFKSTGIAVPIFIAVTGEGL